MKINIPVVLTSSSPTLNAAITSLSIASSSSSVKELVTAFVTSNVATNPVNEGAADGTLVVGAITG